MSLKSTAIFLLGLSLLCLIPTTFTQETCQIRFFPNGINNKDYIYDSNNVAPFTGWAWKDFYQQTDRIQRTFSSLRAVQASWCETCTLTIFSTKAFGGNSEVYSFRDGFEFNFPFCAKSFTLNCDYPQEEEEEMQTPEEEEEEAGQIMFRPLTPAETNDPKIIQLINKGLADAVAILKQMSMMPEGNYQVVQNNSLETATNINDVYQFNVRVSDGQGNVFDVYYLINNDYGTGAVVDWNASRVN